MPSGGARPRSGPKADPHSFRAERADHKTNNLETLPATGRPGPAPAWPLIVVADAHGKNGVIEGLATRLHVRELELWATLWASPQAVIWERDRLEIPVALFVRQLAEGELPLSSAENRKTIKTYLGDLYLNSDALAKGGYRIGTVVPANAEVRRFRVVDD